MQLTKFTDYSLRVMIYLAHHPDQLVTIADIARAYEMPAAHLMKIVNRLAQRGYITTVRGKGGGMRLAREPHLINVGDIVRDSEENMYIAECFNAELQHCPLLPSCRLKAVLGEARKSFMATLGRYQISDLMGPKSPELPSTASARRIKVRTG